jgi:hypothetical protein
MEMKKYYIFTDIIDLNSSMVKAEPENAEGTIRVVNIVNIEKDRQPYNLHLSLCAVNNI